MNLVKKTPVRFHWRLSTSLSYRGGEPEGEIREEQEEEVVEEEEEEEEEEMERGLTLEGEKCFPATSFFFLQFSSGWCLLSKLKSSSNSGHTHTRAHTHTHTHTPLVCISVSGRILHKHPVKKTNNKRLV